jgi:hypothetical protein
MCADLALSEVQRNFTIRPPIVLHQGAKKVKESSTVVIQASTSTNSAQECVPKTSPLPLQQPLQSGEFPHGLKKRLILYSIIVSKTDQRCRCRCRCRSCSSHSAIFFKTWHRGMSKTNAPCMEALLRKAALLLFPEASKSLHPTMLQATSESWRCIISFAATCRSMCIHDLHKKYWEAQLQTELE